MAKCEFREECFFKDICEGDEADCDIAKDIERRKEA
jgi:hypothetical protein